jgi:hypothetical protein
LYHDSPFNWGQIPIVLKKWSPGRAALKGNGGQIPIVLALKNGGNGEMGVRFQLISSLKVTLEPPAMGTHFSGLSLKKWSPGRAALN